MVGAELAEQRRFGWWQDAGDPEAYEDHEHVGGGDPEPDGAGGQARELRGVLPEVRRFRVCGGPVGRSFDRLFYSTRVDTLRAQYPDNPVLHGLSDETRIVVSEPLGDLEGAWNEVPESSYGVVQEGQDELRPFTPRPA